MNIIIFGDSITWGAWDKHGGWAQRLKVYGNNLTASSQFKKYVSVYPLGISGDDTNTLLARLQSELSVRYDPEDENIVIVAIGINDSIRNLGSGENKVGLGTFATNLAKIKEILFNFKLSSIFVGLTSVDESKVYPMEWMSGDGYLNEVIEQYDTAIQDFCEQSKIQFIEINSLFKGHEKELLFDGLHPNEKGHELIFNAVLKRLPIIS